MYRLAVHGDEVVVATGLVGKDFGHGSRSGVDWLNFTAAPRCTAGR